MNTPELPARRTLPPDVRERMRRKVVGGLPETADEADVDVGGTAVDGVRIVVDPVEHRRHRRGPLAAAAAAVLLVGAGAVAVQTFPGSPVLVATATPTLTPADGFAAPLEAAVVPTLPQDLDACGLGGLQATTVRAPGRRLLITPDEEYCEVTYTTVARADTAPYAGLFLGTQKVLWKSPSGVVLVKPVPGSVPSGTVARPGSPITTILVDDDHYLMIPRGPEMTAETTWEEPRYEVPELHRITLPVAARVRDRFPNDSQNPADPRNTLARCLDVAMRDRVDGMTTGGEWTHGGIAGTDTSTGLLAMRGPDGASAYCSVDKYQAKGVHRAPHSTGDISSHSFRVVVRWVGDTRGPDGPVGRIAGTVRDDVARVEFWHAQQSPRVADVREGTFAVRLPGVTPVDGQLADISARVLGHDGHVLFEGRVG
ncbi:hypothetical protein [Actinosynnema sp. NPDC023587]|uniref:hypothetical protein n=1 Tax=Actinosynnema sp. NPDC023587 TaxID=3154695 RepID=UPI0034036A90